MPLCVSSSFLLKTGREEKPGVAGVGGSEMMLQEVELSPKDVGPFKIAGPHCPAPPVLKPLWLTFHSSSNIPDIGASLKELILKTPLK